MEENTTLNGLFALADSMDDVLALVEDLEMEAAMVELSDPQECRRLREVCFAARAKVDEVCRTNAMPRPARAFRGGVA